MKISDRMIGVNVTKDQIELAVAEVEQLKRAMSGEFWWQIKSPCRSKKTYVTKILFLKIFNSKDVNSLIKGEF